MIQKQRIHKMLKVFLMSIIGFVICMAFLPILLPFCLLFFAISKCIEAVVKSLHAKGLTKANGTDVLFGKESKLSYPVINIALRFEGTVSVKKVRDRIVNILNRKDKDENRNYQRLKQIYKSHYGYRFFQDCENFDVDEHIKVLKREDVCRRKLPSDEEKEWKLTIEDIMNEFGGRRFNEEKPQWEFLLLQEFKNKYTILFRIHHSIADGIYLTRMLVELFHGTSTKISQAYVEHSRMVKIWKVLWSICLLPFGLMKMITNCDKNVLHGSKLTGEKRFYVSRSIPMSRLKDIKEKSDVSIHTIVSSCLSSAITAHFKRRKDSSQMITALIPIPLQNLQKPVVLKNKFAIHSFKMPTMQRVLRDEGGQSKASDLSSYCAVSSLHRLFTIREILEDAKLNPTFLSVHLLLTTLCSCLPTKLAESLLSPKGCSIAFSSVPGPSESIDFFGDQMEDTIFWNPDNDPLGACVSILSYGEHFRVGLAFDKALLLSTNEGDLFLEDFEKEMEHLLEELQEEEPTTVIQHKI